MNRRLQARVQRVSCCCRVWDSEKSLRQLIFTPGEQLLCRNGDLTMLSPWILVERTCSRAVPGSRGKDLERARKFWSFMKFTYSELYPRSNLHWEGSGEPAAKGHAQARGLGATTACC